MPIYSNVVSDIIVSKQDIIKHLQKFIDTLGRILIEGESVSPIMGEIRLGDVCFNHEDIKSSKTIEFEIVDREYLIIKLKREQIKININQGIELKSFIYEKNHIFNLVLKQATIDVCNDCGKKGYKFKKSYFSKVLCPHCLRRYYEYDGYTGPSKSRMIV